MTVFEISVDELARKRAAGEPMLLLDIREADEVALAPIGWARWIPMADVPARLAELPDDMPIYVLCHAGVRSVHVTRYLLENGFSNAANVTGGIDAWSTIDPSIPRY